MNTRQQHVSIRRLQDIEESDRLRSALADIMFAASNTTTFSDDAARNAFQWRWLDQFLTHDPSWVYVATSDDFDLAHPDTGVIGYLVASLDDPAHSPRFSELGYFQDFKHVTCSFPAQLHVNLKVDARGHGIGTALIEAFVRDARKSGCPGVHVVTGANARNVSFYERAGFQERARSDWHGAPLVFLARAL